MKSGDYVIITKLKAVDNPAVPTPDKKDYIPGGINLGVSLPVDYTIEGYLLSDIKVGERVIVDRRKRNGMEIGGLFSSSYVVSLNKDRFTTQNSVYLIKKR